MNVMSVAFPGDSIRKSFLVTFVPIVVMYSSENLSTTKRRMRLVLPTSPSPRSKIFRLMWSSTMTYRSMRGPLLYRLLTQCQRCEYEGSVRMEPEARADESRRDEIRLREERHVPVPLGEDIGVRPFELPHRDLEFPRQIVQVPAHDDGREDRMLAPEHEHLTLPEA